MNITKVEEIILLERDIESAKKSLAEWQEYADGKRDVKSEFGYIIKDAKEDIEEIAALLISENPDDKRELKRVIENFYDNHYYDYDSAKECADDFKANYATILIDEAQKRYDYKIKQHSPEQAKTECKSIERRINEYQNRLNLMMSALNWIDRQKLKLTRSNLFYARVNNSPSFIYACAGRDLTKEFARGLEGAER